MIKIDDICEYDYNNDWVSRRYEVSGSNDVIIHTCR
jgi:acyl-ACP thioesterase